MSNIEAIVHDSTTSRKRPKNVSQTLPDEAAIPEANDPFSTIETWLVEAAASEPNNPEAMSLATVDETGLPNLRTVLLKGLDGAGSTKRGLIFYTNTESSKGRELATNPKAALLFYWKSLGRQIRVRGTVSTLADTEADAYFASRPRESCIGAWASDQSRPLDTRETLQLRVEQFTQKFDGRDVRRPPHWSGYRLAPLQIEFWQNGADRLHNRLVYNRADTAENTPWKTQRLYP